MATATVREKLKQLAADTRMHAGVLAGRLMRTKGLKNDVAMETPLRRCLSTFDITLLGIGHMVGAGIYVLAGQVAHSIAGPAIVVSFALAGFASLLAALCYAEFGARVPKTGSAYTYTYVTMGEFWAFVIGWNIILEHMLGAAAVARAWSGYVDSLFNGAISNGTMSNIGTLHAAYIAAYPDFVAAGVLLIVAVFAATGARTSINFNTIFTFLNLAVVVFVVGVGFSYADVGNWTNSATGGFMPFGFSGIVAGAATCFFAYIGFDGIATSAEEAKDPSKSLPIATILAMFIVSVCYILVSSALTLMVPYVDIQPTAAFAMAFAEVNLPWAKYVVAVGALCGITTSLAGSMFALPRCVYAMASDGLLFRTFSRVNPTTQVPVLAVAFFSFLAALIALFFDLETLVEFLSIGTLLAYTIVSASVIVLRYRPAHKIKLPKPESMMSVPSGGEPATYEKFDERELDEAGEEEVAGRLKPSFQHIGFLNRLEPGTAVCICVVILLVGMMCMCGVIQKGMYDLKDASWWAVCLALLFGVIIIVCVFVICIHQQSTAGLSFKVPFVPLLPTVSILCNAALVMNLSWPTWIRFAIWMAIGLIVYFAYGIHNSGENEAEQVYSALVATSMSTEKLCPMDESVHMPQPIQREDSNYGALSPTSDTSPLP